MDDPERVRMRERARKLHAHVQHLHRRRWPLAKPGSEADAAHVLHDDVHALVRLEDVVDGGDVRVVQPRRSPRLAHQPAAELGCIQPCRPGQRLQRDAAMKARVFREIDLAVRARPQALEESIRAHRGKGHG